MAMFFLFFSNLVGEEGPRIQGVKDSRVFSEDFGRAVSDPALLAWGELVELPRRLVRRSYSEGGDQKGRRLEINSEEMM